MGQDLPAGDRPLSPIIGNDKASAIVRYAMDGGLTFKEAALQLGFVTELEARQVISPQKMVRSYVAASVAAPQAAHV